MLEALGRPLRLGVIGGGVGSFIGPVHRSAAVLDQRIEIVAGVLSSSPEKSRGQAVALGLVPSRAYTAVDEMLARQAARQCAQERGLSQQVLGEVVDSHDESANA